MYSPSSKQTAVLFASVVRVKAVLQLLFCSYLCFCRCALCRSVSDSYDSLNAKYGLNGQAVFARVNVDKLKVSDIKLS